jgi:3'-phosphoadenosine 5'-phosphosulfate sulfotransferase (PAPS reductase)/FAD synthetase
MVEKPVRDLLDLSGECDSNALGVVIRLKYPEIKIEYFFCDTHKELPETYKYLKRIEARLRIESLALLVICE